MPYPSKKFRQNPFTSLRVIRRTDKQTDRQTDCTKNITSFFGGGNKSGSKNTLTFRSFQTDRPTDELGDRSVPRFAYFRAIYWPQRRG